MNEAWRSQIDFHEPLRAESWSHELFSFFTFGLFNSGHAFPHTKLWPRHVETVRSVVTQSTMTSVFQEMFQDLEVFSVNLST